MFDWSDKELYVFGMILVGIFVVFCSSLMALGAALYHMFGGF